MATGIVASRLFSGAEWFACRPIRADYHEWIADDLPQQLARLLARVTDHGQGEYIVSVHWLKLILAMRVELQHGSSETGALVLAATERFIESPQRRRQVRRTAHQSLKFVARA